MKTVIFILLLITSFSSCNRHDNNKEQFQDTLLSVKPSAPITNRKLMRELIDNAILQGNAKAYNRVASYYLIEDQGQDFFYYAFIMANKNKSAEATYHVYNIIVSARPEVGVGKDALKAMDNKTKYFAMYYLLKSYEMGYQNAKFEIDEIFGENNPIPKSSLYLEKFSAD